MSGRAILRGLRSLLGGALGTLDDGADRIRGGIKHGSDALANSRGNAGKLVVQRRVGLQDIAEVVDRAADMLLHGLELGVCLTGQSSHRALHLVQLLYQRLAHPVNTLLCGVEGRRGERSDIVCGRRRTLTIRREYQSSGKEDENEGTYMRTDCAWSCLSWSWE